MRRIVGALLLMIASHATAKDYPAVPLDELLSKKRASVLAVDRMSEDQKETLRRLIIDAYRAGLAQGSKQGNVPPSAVESQIDGDFEGWEGETVVKLTNGEIWQQTEYHYEYHYAFMPEVVVYRTTGGFKMKVDGMDTAVGVQRLK